MQGYESSGLSQIAYCEREGHSFRQFKYYRSRFAQLAKSKTRLNKKASETSSAFAPLPFTTPPSQGLRLELGNGAYCIMRTPGDALLVNALLRGLR
jgi:hypothetical protein